MTTQAAAPAAEAVELARRINGIASMAELVEIADQECLQIDVDSRQVRVLVHDLWQGGAVVARAPQRFQVWFPGVEPTVKNLGGSRWWRWLAELDGLQFSTNTDDPVLVPEGVVSP